MATQTSNLGLTKPAYSETADIADINNNMDKVDAAVHGVQNGMAILANGNVHSAVTSGQYVYVRNHGTLAEGLYTATTNISTNATLSTSNLTAVPNNGALNTLRDDVSSLNSNITAFSITFTPSSNVTATVATAYRIGKLLVFTYYMTLTDAVSRLDVLGSFDLPGHFLQNFFNSDNQIALRGGTKNVTTEKAMESGTVITGQLIGVIS